MPQRILLAMDMLDARQRQRIAAAAAGWAVLACISETTTDVDYAARLAETDVVVGWPRAEVLHASPVRFLQIGSAGVDAYLGRGLEYKTGFTLCNARGVMAVPVAEHAIAMMLALARQIPRHLRARDERIFARGPLASYAELSGATVCVVGLGDIGQTIARGCAGLGMRVVGVRRDPANPRPDGVERVFPVEELTEAVANADHVVVVAPGGAETAGMFDARVFAAMRPGSRFYNLSRGSVVDETALRDALRRGHLTAAGLDVFAEEPLPVSSPWWAFDNVLITPHCGGLSAKFADRFCDLVVANLLAWRDGAALRNVVALGPHPGETAP